MILVTGATGHIGTVLVHRLTEAYPDETIRLFILPEESIQMLKSTHIEPCLGDICDRESVFAAVRNVRLVFHLAGIVDPSEHDPEQMYRVNVIGTRNVVQACLAAKTPRLVYVSSVHALPDEPVGTMIRERTDFNSQSRTGPYALSKSEATAEVFAAASQGLSAVVVFPSGIIGPDDVKLSDMGRLFRYLNRHVNIHHILGFKGAYDFVDVRDVVEGLLTAAQTNRSGEGFILSGHRITIPDLMRLVRKTLGQSRTVVLLVPVWLASISAWINRLICQLFRQKPVLSPYSVKVLQSNSWISHEKATRELGYMPRPLIETIRDSIDWLKAAGQI